MLQFTVLDGKLIVDPSMLMRPEFVDILEYGKKKNKEEFATKMLLYIFYCCDLTKSNPISQVDYRMKEEQAAKMAFRGAAKFTKKEQELVDAGIDAYNFCNEGALERASLAYDQKIDEIRTLLEGLEPEVHAKYKEHMCDFCNELHSEPINQVLEIEDYVSNDRIIANFAKQLNEIATYKLKALETAKKIENTGRVRGDKGSSLIERGAFRKKVEGEK